MLCRLCSGWHSIWEDTFNDGSLLNHLWLQLTKSLMSLYFKALSALKYKLEQHKNSLKTKASTHSKTRACPIDYPKYFEYEIFNYTAALY
ncbi:MAG: hypothetical protein AAGA75_21145, partial [Cyanobacteria bacterium P01_E01_bin.6]